MNFYDEKEYAEHLLEKGFSRFMNSAEIIILAKYFRSLGCSEYQIEKEVHAFCEKFEPDYNEVLFSKKIHSKIVGSKKSGLRRFSPIPIRKSEIEKIKTIKNYRLEKVLFVALVLAKFYKITNTNKSDTKTSPNYFLKAKYSTLLAEAHVAEKKGESIISDLFSLGMMGFNKAYESYMILFSSEDDDSEILFYVDDLRNIVKFYPPYCKVCGLPLEKNHNKNETHYECFKAKREETEFLRVWG